MKNRTLSQALFRPVAVATLGILLLASLLYYYLIGKTISSSFNDRYQATQTLFAENVRNDILIGSYAEVYKKCQNFFESKVVESIEVIASDKTIICSFNRLSNSKKLKIITQIFFDDNQREAAGTVSVEYSQKLLFDLRRQTLTIVFTTIAVLIVLLMFLIRKVSNTITSPITELSNLLKSGSIENLLQEGSFSNKSQVIEVEILYSETESLARRVQKYQADLVKRKTQETYSKLASQLAHDIRSPLVALNVAIESSDLSSEISHIALSAIGRIREIADNLLKASKSTEAFAENLTPNLIWPLIEAIVSEKRLEFSNWKNLDFKLTCDQRAISAFVKLQKPVFLRIMSNLINNAVEATQGKNLITINLQLTEQGVIRVEVIDCGKGIPAEKLALLGQEGITFGKSDGNGLGLYHAIKTIKTWNGQISIESKVGIGTSVSIWLPQVEAPKCLASNLDLKSKDRVIVLDDDPSIHEIWKKKFLEHQVDNELFHFTNVDEFLSWRNNGNTMNNKYLLDHNISEGGKTGFDLIEFHGLQEESILVTNSYEEQFVIERCEFSRIRLLPKILLPVLPINKQVPEKNIKDA